ncbi:MAG: YegP family protein [Thermoanaerobaculia bacterium]
MAGTFVIEAGKTGKLRFNLRSGNHQVILTSETYDSKAAVENGIESVRKNAADESSFERKTAKDGSAYFVIKAKNGQVIGKSEMYKSPSGMENGIKSVAANAPSATIVDRTS